MTTPAIPLYPTSRPFKNIISDWSGESIIVNNIPSDIFNKRSKTLSASEKALYSAFQMRWYFANIGYESDEEFIYRVNAVWNAYIKQFVKLYEIAEGELGTVNEKYDSTSTDAGTRVVKETGTRKEQQSGSHTVTETGSRTHVDTESHSGENIVHTAHSGEDIVVNNSVDISRKDMTEETSRLSRSTPNEQAESVSNDTTNAESKGSNSTTHGHDINVTETRGIVTTLNRTETPNITRKETPNITRTITPNTTVTETPNLTHERDETSSRTYRTADEIGKIQRLKNVLSAFANLFENLFDEVIF